MNKKNHQKHTHQKKKKSISTIYYGLSFAIQIPLNVFLTKMCFHRAEMLLITCKYNTVYAYDRLTLIKLRV